MNLEDLAIMLICCPAIALILLSIGLSILKKKRSQIIDEYKKIIDRSLNEIGFNASRSINYENGYALKIDESKQQVAFCKYGMNSYKIYNFSDLIRSEIVEDDRIVKTGGVGRNIIGGVVAGAAGVLIAESTRKSHNLLDNLRVNIYTKDIHEPLYFFNFSSKKGAQKIGPKYQAIRKFAEDVYATVESIASQYNR